MQTNNTAEEVSVTSSNNTSKGIFGIHHVTAITSNPQKNIDFYTGSLGLRLVKLTVNQDDPAAYHLYYGDELGHPGTILTFFHWPNIPRGRRGTSQVIATAFLNIFEFLFHISPHLIKSPKHIFKESPSASSKESPIPVIWLNII
jgi:catechol 2,3-dioxygenase-like lactoylglutathione lyase family enzyme